MPSPQTAFVIRRKSAHIGRKVSMAFKSLKGQLLLDNGRLHGSFFHRSVLLICEHDKEGAFGLMLNRITGSKVGDGLTGNLPESIKAQDLFLGGPVQPQALSYLHSDEFLPDASVLPNLNLDHSLENLVELGDSFSSTQRIKVFAGYAGWSPGQLDDEMKRDTWLTHPASLDLVFHEKPDELWAQILKLKGWKYRLIAEQPGDLSAN
jgi:putative transcriptional regulator